jgi:hypothetical protein
VVAIHVLLLSYMISVSEDLWQSVMMIMKPQFPVQVMCGISEGDVQA